VSEQGNRSTPGSALCASREPNDGNGDCDNSSVAREVDYVTDPRYCGKQTDGGGVIVTCWRPAGHVGIHQGELIDGKSFGWHDHAAYGPEEGMRCPDCRYIVVTGLCCSKGRERREKQGWRVGL
jgi:hypothetical protein